MFEVTENAKKFAENATINDLDDLMKNIVTTSELTARKARRGLEAAAKACILKAEALDNTRKILAWSTQIMAGKALGRG